MAEPEQEAVVGWAAQNRAPIVWAPQPGAQTALLTCPYDEILYGGAKGGGKSDGELGAWLGHMAQNATHLKHARGIIFRKAYPDLEQLMARAWEIFSPLGARWNANKKTWYFKGGATLKFRFVANKKDAAKYQGHEYTFMGFDEVGEIGEESIINTLRGALRNSKGVKPLLLLTGNPLGPGHKWLMRRFIKDKSPYQPTVEEMELKDGTKTTWTRVFIPSTLDDNPLLMKSQPGYEMQLKQMCAGKPGLYQALRFGDWNAKLEIPGALWTQDTIDQWRVSLAPDLVKVVVSIDPSVGEGGEKNDAAGIAVVGQAADKHRYLLKSISVKGRPKVWASVAIKLYHQFKADWIVAESNNGGIMVEDTIKAVDPNPKVVLVNASRGKRTRAEPISAEYDRGLWHHVGEFPQLESEQTTWVPGEPSPNEMDAVVWAGHQLAGSTGQFGITLL